MRSALAGGTPYGTCQVLGALAAAGEVVADHGVRGTRGERHALDHGDLRRLVRGERVYRDDCRQAISAHDLDVLEKIGAAALDAIGVLILECRIERLAGDDMSNTAVHLEGA